MPSRVSTWQVDASVRLSGYFSMAMEGKKAFLKIHATVNATPGLPLQQLQNALRALVGLRQNRRGSLLDNLGAGKIG